MGYGPNLELLTPLDPVPYDHYWSNLAEENPLLERVAHGNSREVTELAASTIDQPSMTCDRGVIKQVRAWYSTLGGHNNMHGAETALERAFSIVYQAGSIQGTEPTRHIEVGADPLSLSARLGPETHRRMSSLELSAELAHERLWLEPDHGRFEPLSVLAHNLYGASLERYGHFEVKERTLRHQYDIAFGLVHRDLRQLAARGLGQTRTAQDAKEHFRFLQQAFGHDLIRLTNEPNANTGHLFEWLFAFVYRSYMARHGLLADHELRTGLIRHDMPRDSLRGTANSPSQASDYIIVRHGPRGKSHQFVQCKLSRSDRVYSPNVIEVIARRTGVAELLLPRDRRGSEYDAELRAALCRVTKEVLAHHEGHTDQGRLEEIDSLVVPRLRAA